MGWHSRTLNALGPLTLLFCFNASMVTYASGDEQAVESQKNLAWPTLPGVQLSLMTGFETETAYTAKTASGITAIEQEAAQTSDQQKKVNLLLAAANQVLAFQMEPTISRHLLGLETEVKTNDHLLPSTMLAHMRELLTDSEVVIEHFGQGELDDKQQAWHSQVRRQLRLLRGFAAGVEALINAELDQASLRDAASRLSILREDNDKKVMSAAGLWQAIVRSKMADPVRALDVLPLALSDIRKESQADSFFARILRCELLAGQERYATSLALLTEIEELCDQWFDRDADRATAVRTAAWMQLRVLRRWHLSLVERGSKTAAQWCVQRASSIMDRRFSGDKLSLLRLTPAVPVVVPPTNASGHGTEKGESKP